MYRYSVIPGGVAGRDELARAIRTDRVAAAHYASFDVDRARVVPAKARAVHVSYRKGDRIYWTARKVMLAEGEPLLSDGRSLIRARCGNRIADQPQSPVEPGALDERDLDDTEAAGGAVQVSADGSDEGADSGEAPAHAAAGNAAGSSAGSAAAGGAGSAGAAGMAADNRARTAAGFAHPVAAREPERDEPVAQALAAVEDAAARNAQKARASGRRVSATSGGSAVETQAADSLDVSASPTAPGPGDDAGAAQPPSFAAALAIEPGANTAPSSAVGAGTQPLTTSDPTANGPSVSFTSVPSVSGSTPPFSPVGMPLDVLPVTSWAADPALTPPSLPAALAPQWNQTISSSASTLDADVPEPATPWLIAAGLAVLALRRTRRPARP